MLTSGKIKEVSPLLAELSTGVLQVRNLTLMVHELMMAIEKHDPFAEKYGEGRERIDVVSACLRILCARTPQPLRGVLLRMIEDGVPQMVTCIHAVYIDGRQSMLDYLNGEPFLYWRADEDEESEREPSRLGVRYGLRRAAVDARDDVVGPAAAAPPPKWDLRGGGRLAPPSDRGRSATGAVHAACAALAYAAARRRSKGGVEMPAGWTPSRAYLYYTARAFVARTPLSEDSGCSLRDACKAIRNHHVCDERFMHYDDSRVDAVPSALAVANANLHGSVKYRAVRQDLTDLKASVAADHPVMCGLKTFSSFELQETMKTGLMPVPLTAEEGHLGDQAALIVGYNDVDRRFVCQLSLGPDVGDAGYFHVPYEYVMDPDLCYDMWILQYT